MLDHIRVNKRIIPSEHIALLEPYTAGPASYPTTKDFKTRVILVDRESVLSEIKLGLLAEDLGFPVLPTDDVATNPAINFQVESFEPSADFQPSKPFRSRLIWRDGTGNTQSKLMLGEPLEVLAVAVRRERTQETSSDISRRPKAKGRARPRKSMPAPR